MKNPEINALSIEDIKERIAKENENYQKLIKNPMKIRETRKLIARLNTALKAKQQEN